MTPEHIPVFSINCFVAIHETPETICQQTATFLAPVPIPVYRVLILRPNYFPVDSQLSGKRKNEKRNKAKTRKEQSLNCRM